MRTFARLQSARLLSVPRRGVVDTRGIQPIIVIGPSEALTLNGLLACGALSYSPVGARVPKLKDAAAVGGPSARSVDDVDKSCHAYDARVALSWREGHSEPENSPVIINSSETKVSKIIGVLEILVRTSTGERLDPLIINPPKTIARNAAIALAGPLALRTDVRCRERERLAASLIQ